MPAHTHDSPLVAALSYYSSIVTLNAEGDSMVADETLEGLGTTGFLLNTLFGSILRLAQPAPLDQSPSVNATTTPPTTSTTTNTKTSTGAGAGASTDSSQRPPSRKPPMSSQLKPPLENDTAASDNMEAPYATQPQSAAGSKITPIQQVQQATGAAVKGLQVMTTSGTSLENDSSDRDYLDIHDHHPQLQWRDVDVEIEEEEEECDTKTGISRLTQYLPEPGYFIAGALAGGISRTATAPLDRLKVYLLVNTKTKAGAALDAAKTGQTISAVRTASQPIRNAVHDLWRAGGIRTFFAGKHSSTRPLPQRPSTSAIAPDRQALVIM